MVAPLTNQTASDSFGFDMVPQNSGPLLRYRMMEVLEIKTTAELIHYATKHRIVSI